jgi:hypothetical protein
MELALNVMGRWASRSKHGKTQAFGLRSKGQREPGDLASLR